MTFKKQIFRHMKKSILTSVIILVLCSSMYGKADHRENVVWVELDRSIKDYKNVNSYGIDDTLETLIREMEVSNFEKVFPHSKNDYLLSIYKMELGEKFIGKTDDFISELEKNKPAELRKIIRIPTEEKVSLYDPSDYYVE
jgi:hypothetical protein